MLTTRRSAEFLDSLATALAAIAVFGAFFAAVIGSSDPKNAEVPRGAVRLALSSVSSFSWVGALSDITSPDTEEPSRPDRITGEPRPEVHATGART
jgi:hypothetical protein